jgi:putative pentapeptide repeat protein
VRKLWKNPNSNARFAATGSCAEKFKKRGVKFFALQNAGFFATKFGSTKFCGAEPRAHDAALGDFKFRDEKFRGVKFATCGTEFLGANFRGAEFCKSKFMARGVKFYKAELRETGFLTRTAELYGTKFHEMKFQTLNLELKMKFSEAKFGEVKFRDGALLKFAAVKGLRRSPSLCAAAPFKFIALQNAGFFATKFDEAEFYGVKFHKTRLRRKKFYATEFAAKCEKFCGMKRRGAGA